MNKEELANYIFNFWNDWGAFNHEERFDEEIKAEIWENLNSIKGINDEIQYTSQEIEAGWDENSLEYKNLTTLLNHLNEYLTMFTKELEESEE